MIKQFMKDIYNLKDKIKVQIGFKFKLSKEIKSLEKKITLFHAKIVKEIIQCLNLKIPKIDFVGFHGQTIFHNPREKISCTIG